MPPLSWPPWVCGCTSPGLPRSSLAATAVDCIRCGRIQPPSGAEGELLCRSKFDNVSGVVCLRDGVPLTDFLQRPDADVRWVLALYCSMLSWLLLFQSWRVCVSLPPGPESRKGQTGMRPVAWYPPIDLGNTAGRSLQMTAATRSSVFWSSACDAQSLDLEKYLVVCQRKSMRWIEKVSLRSVCAGPSFRCR